MDKILFKRSKTASWDIRVYDKDNDEAYGNHITCPLTSYEATNPEQIKKAKSMWSWLVDDDNNVCWGCGGHVPDYIQALIRMYENK